MALRGACPELRIIGYARREESIRLALELGAIAEGDTQPSRILSLADLTVVCMPVSTTVAFIEDHGTVWSPGSIVTDVGSTKAGLVPACTRALAPNGVHFVGSHPMAGKERSGLEHAEANLYQRASVFLCREDATPPAALQTVGALWSAVGGRTAEIDPTTHDALVARSSHVPHLLAAAAVRLLPDLPNAVNATAGAFRDVTRIAASSPSMWTDICRQNRTEVLDGLHQLIAMLSQFQDLIRQEQWDDLLAELEQARRRRLDWEAAKSRAGGQTSE